MAWLTRFGWLVGGKKTDINLVMVGLVNSGKSTLMRQLKPRDTQMEQLNPLIPLAKPAEQFHYKAIRLSAFDLSDESGSANPWEDLYRHCHGFIFVVDSTDRMNFLPVNVQLCKLLQHPLLKDRKMPVLVLANKMDIPSSISHYQLSDILGINDIKDTALKVFSTDGLTGEGLGEALDWLALELKRYR